MSTGDASGDSVVIGAVKFGIDSLRAARVSGGELADLTSSSLPCWSVNSSLARRDLASEGDGVVMVYLGEGVRPAVP